MKFGDMLKFKAKERKTDFTEYDLPATRWAMFFDSLKLNFWKLIIMNTMVLIFMLPYAAAAFLLIPNILLAMEQSGGSVLGAMPFIVDRIIAGGKASFFYEPQNVLSLVSLFLVVAIPLYTIAGPAKAGMYYIVRNFSWGEPAFSMKDFWKAFRQNWKQGLLINFISATVTAAAFYAVQYYGNLYVNLGSALYLIATGTVIATLTVFTLMKVYIYPMLVTYKLKLKNIYKNAFIFTFLQLPYVLGMAILAALTAGLFIIGTQIYVFYMLLIGFGLAALACMTFSNHVFDKYMNDKIEGAVKRRGMRPLNKFPKLNNK